MPRELEPCGTNAAYVRHVRHKEPTCQPCRDAHAAYNRENEGGGRPRGEAKCGTQAGYDKHLRLRQETCAECRAAHSKHVSKYAKQRRAELDGAACDPQMPLAPTPRAVENAVLGADGRELL